MTRPTRRQLLALLASTPVALAGCGYRAGPGDPVWRDDLGFGAVVPAGDALVSVGQRRNADFETTGVEFTVYDPATGDAREEVEYDTPLRGVTGGERCYFVAEEEVGAVESTGSVGWTRSAPRSIVAMGAGSRTLVFLQEDGGVVALDGTDGSPRWGADTDVRAEAREGDPDVEVVADGDGAVVAVERAGVASVGSDGEVHWERTGLEIDLEESGLALGEDVVLVPGDSSVPVFDRESGERRFVIGGNPPNGAPAVVNGTAYVAHGPSLAAYDLATGDRRWSIEDSPDRTGMVLRDGVVADEDGVYAGGLRGIHSIAPDGTRRWFTDDIGGECMLFPTVVISDTADGYTAYNRQRE